MTPCGVFLPIHPFSVLKDLNSFSHSSQILTISILAMFPLLFFNSSIVESSKPVLIAITSSAKLVSKPDTKLLLKLEIMKKLKLLM